MAEEVVAGADDGVAGEFHFVDWGEDVDFWIAFFGWMQEHGFGEVEFFGDSLFLVLGEVDIGDFHDGDGVAAESIWF